jgi:rare lipoprotein A
MTSILAERRPVRPRIFAMGPVRLCLAALVFEGALAGLAHARFDAPATLAVAYAAIRQSSHGAGGVPPADTAFRFNASATFDSPLFSALGDDTATGAISPMTPRLPLPPISAQPVGKPAALQPANITIEEPEAALAPTMIVGAASMYDPTDPADKDAGDAETASGEFYDRNGWTAAIQIDLRGQFNGVRYRMRYEPTYALVEAAGKRVIVRINDVGPLRPGRIIDLNARTMRFFDPTMTVGVLQAVRVTPLPSRDWFVGPVEDEDDATPVAQASLAVN